jgi:hypothetical protein
VGYISDCIEKASNIIAKFQYKLLTSPAQARLRMAFTLPALLVIKDGWAYY